MKKIIKLILIFSLVFSNTNKELSNVLDDLNNERNQMDDEINKINKNINEINKEASAKNENSIKDIKTFEKLLEKLQVVKTSIEEKITKILKAKTQQEINEYTEYVI